MTTLRLRTDRVSWREVDGEMIAVDAGASRYLSANRSGLVLWEMLAGGATRSELADRLVSIFGIDGARARTDVDAFLAMLRERDLLEA